MCDLLKIDNLLLPEYTYMHQLMNSFHAEFIKNVDNEIKKALILNGINPDDIEFLKENIQCISREDDKFEHYFFRYGTLDEKRIISIEKEPKINQNYTDNKHTISAYKRYY